MTKAVVAAKLAERLGLSHKQSVDAIEIFLDCVKDALKDCEKVSLVGFGTFYVKERNERNGRNPRTGRSIHIPRKRVPTFKPGKAFREAIRTLAIPANYEEATDDDE
jgi:DNA-binding protein HU-beta